VSRAVGETRHDEFRARTYERPIAAETGTQREGPPQGQQAVGPAKGRSQGHGAPVDGLAHEECLGHHKQPDGEPRGVEPEDEPGHTRFVAVDLQLLRQYLLAHIEVRDHAHQAAGALLHHRDTVTRPVEDQQRLHQLGIG
jgi:hypothetical protein